MSTGKTFDLKVGYGCNNKCVHCVISPNVDALQRSHVPIDTTYAELVKIMQSEKFALADAVVVTGGEPTIRKDFIRIMEYIVKTYPEKKIFLQTNARNLLQHLDKLHALTDNIHYVVAVHSSTEQTHNKIVGNVKSDKSPYQETMASIKKIQELYPDFNSRLRIEIVLSQYNFKDLPKTISELYSMGMHYIGVSYPHLDGHYDTYGSDFVKKLSLSYKDLKSILPEVYEFAKEHPDFRLGVEAVPPCMFRDADDNLLPVLSNITSMSDRENEDISVKFPGTEMIDFSNVWRRLHKQSARCSECVLCCKCLGVWWEAIDAFGDEGFTPITREEYNKIGGI